VTRRLWALASCRPLPSLAPWHPGTPTPHPPTHPPTRCRILYKLDELVRPYVHKILVVIEPLLIDEDYYARVEGREIIANLSKAAGGPCCWATPGRLACAGACAPACRPGVWHGSARPPPHPAHPGSALLTAPPAPPPPPSPRPCPQAWPP
jgi:hypothetical protein